MARGVGVEAGLWSGTDGLDRFLCSPLRHRVLRVLIEVIDADATVARRSARDMLLRLEGWAPERLLLHGEGDVAWPVLRDAVTRGLSTRIGLEDTTCLPDGSPADDNASLVAAARALLDR